ncbi:hypothetical protein B0H15DRAFT_770032 [Mycena belliarum]|uniref:Uncharacterized protein n=1 Tax=Mycena belliarum TaxID=1033014 RepID=A0AAD6XWD2_9AGAR|nr:hypothetical protein B0H15DRAFT_770032 [Mycena belliae]
MSRNFIPLKFLRLVTLFLAWAWGITTLGAGINAFVKSKRDTDSIRGLVRPPITVSIGTKDVFQSGFVVTAVCAIIAALCALFIGLLLLDISCRSTVSTRTLTVQYLSLGFLALWLFATQIAVTDFVATRSVKADAFVFGVQVPDRLVKRIIAGLGLKTAYRSYDYLKLIAILPWFTLLFSVIAAVVTFMASARAHRHVNSAGVPPTRREKPATANNGATSNQTV